MSGDSNDRPSQTCLTRSGLLSATAALGSTLGFALGRTPAASATPAISNSPANSNTRDASKTNAIEAFFGEHQAGITTPQQRHTFFAALELATAKRSDVIAMLQTWTRAAEAMTSGGPVASITTTSYDQTRTIPDSGDALGLAPSRLTLTFGFGAGLFSKEGVDRYGLAAMRPAALIDLPKFNGDQMIEGKTGGDLSIQACANDPQVAFHAVRQLTRLAGAAAQIKWVQAGFHSPQASGATPRNLMGFRDGTQTVDDLHKYVWVGSEGPRWLQGGSYVVARRIRIALEHWDQTDVGFQEQTVGRKKQNGAPLGADRESDALPLQAMDRDGNPIIPENSHVRVANASTNGGIQILRRGYSFNDGLNFVSERWPPWRQGLEYDAGLLFVCYQRDPATGFVPMFEKMSKIDMLNQFTTHTGGALFACPGGIARGEYLGQSVFENA